MSMLDAMADVYTVRIKKKSGLLLLDSFITLRSTKLAFQVDIFTCYLLKKKRKGTFRETVHVFKLLQNTTNCKNNLITTARIMTNFDNVLRIKRPCV